MCKQTRRNAPRRSAYVLILCTDIHYITGVEKTSNHVQSKRSARKIASFRWRFKRLRVNASFPTPRVGHERRRETSSRFGLTESPTIKLQIGARLPCLLNLRGEHVAKLFVRFHRHQAVLGAATWFRRWCLRETFGTPCCDYLVATVLSFWTIHVLENN